VKQFLFVIGVLNLIIFVGIAWLFFVTLRDVLAPTNSDNFGDDE
jgi:high-affinity nickel permease